MVMSANIFNHDVLEEFEVEALLNELGGNGNQAQAICPHCGADITDADYECPSCGVVLKVAPKRKTAATRELLQVIESENMNGDYHMYRLPDGTLYCDCFSFLFQKGVKEECKQATCKHIRKFIESRNIAIQTLQDENLTQEQRQRIQQQIQSANFPATQPLTDWQKVLFKKLGIVPHKKLSREQGYWIIRDLLSKMGVEYYQFVKIVRENPTYELLPLYSYGVELEGLIRSRDEMYEKMREIGFKVKQTGYSHEMGNKLWKIGDDGSVRRSMNDEESRNYRSMELTSPKLFGDDGFKEIKKAIKIWNEIGGKVNNSCGFHTHINAWDYTKEELKRLLLVWAKIEPVIYFLVSPSRRNNNFAQFWNRDTQNIVSAILRDIPSRYFSLNLMPYQTYKTVEFRIHQGTMNADKVIYWVVFCLKLVQKVKEGLKWYHFSDNPNIEEVLGKLGITTNAIPIIKKTREYLLERYQYFSNGNSCDLRAFDPESIRDEIRNDIISRYSSRMFYFPSSQGDRSMRPRNHIESIAVINPRNLIPYSEIASLRRDDNSFIIRSNSNSNRFYTVNYDPEQETITCDCRGFRQNRYCSHSISIARYLWIQKEVQKENLDF